MGDKTSPAKCDSQPFIRAKTNNTNEAPGHWRVGVAVVAAVLGSGVSSGYSLGVLNTPQEIIRGWIKSTVPSLTEGGELSVWATVVTIYVVGAIIGAQLGAKLADRFGRRLALLYNHVVLVVAGVVLVASRGAGSVEMLVLGRLLTGLCTGVGTSVVPLYLSEVAPASLRGVMAITFPMGLCVGVLVAQLLGLASVMGTSESWHYLLGSFLVFVAVAIVLHPVIPESPAYLAAKRTQALAETPRTDKESKYLEDGATTGLLDGADSPHTWSFWSMVRQPHYRLPLLIPAMLNVGQQLSGINAVFYYSTFIFRGAGLTLAESQGASIGAGVINCVMSVAAVPLVKVCRRRSLLMVSVASCIGCQAVLVAALGQIQQSVAASYVAIGALMCYVLCYGVGLGPVPFMLATELFPAGPRSVGVCVGGTSNWISNFVVGLSFPLLQTHAGHYSFCVFIACQVLLLGFVYMFVPETLGKDSPPPNDRDVSKCAEKASSPSHS